MPREVGGALGTLFAFALIAWGVALLPNVARFQAWFVREITRHRFVPFRRHAETRPYQVALRIQALASIAVGVALLWAFAH
jgi:hypothetical protein